MRFLIIGIVLLLLTTELVVAQSTRTQIEVGHGPEDIVLDTIIGERLLISCAQRRCGNEEYNGIWEYDFKSEKSRQLTLVLKEERVMKPHGISILQDDGVGYLFVINHIAKKDNEVIRFRITADTLYEEKSFKNTVLKRPNDLYATGVEKFFFSNDNMIGGSLGRYNDGTYGLISKGHSYANGVHEIKGVVYLSTTTSNKIFSFAPDWQSHKIIKKKLFKVKGADNFTVTERKTLLVTSHPKLGKFLKHYKDFEKKSPSMVYELDLENQSSKVIYQDPTGNEISACSTALEYKGFLYLAQVFDPYLLRVSLIGEK